MAIKYGVGRLSLENLLLQFSDADYQREAWLEIDVEKLPPRSFAGVETAMEAFIDDYDWKDGQELIGIFLRNTAELDACLALQRILHQFFAKMGRGLPETAYLHDPIWPQVIAAARHALRVMNQGNI